VKERLFNIDRRRASRGESCARALRRSKATRRFRTANRPAPVSCGNGSDLRAFPRDTSQTQAPNHPHRCAMIFEVTSSAIWCGANDRPRSAKSRRNVAR